MPRSFYTILLLGVVASLLASVEGAATAIQEHDDIAAAVSLLRSLGVPQANLCTVTESYEAELLPRCLDTATATATATTKSPSPWIRSRRQRYLQEDPEEEHDTWFYISHALCAFACVVVAALAAGLTMGLLSLDPLLLLIKMRAGSTKKEQDQAASLLPIVKQHHLLLVTLLLLNSIANEALPLFLEVLVSPLIAVVLSVTLVLFFGEIIPSAVFTGPNKIALASQMTPVVKLVMFLLWPIAFPIAKILDHVLHDDDDEEHADAFNRGELSALVRIQYEERMAAKQQRKKEKAQFAPTTATTSRTNPDHVGGLDFTIPSTDPAVSAEIRASKREAARRFSHRDTTTSSNNNSMSTLPEVPEVGGNAITRTTPKRSVSIHVDEVSMVEGALQMKTLTALDVFTPIHRMFAINYDTLLTERTVVHIYSSGYSRIPVFEFQPQKPKNHTALRGILMTKQLIVVNPSENRPITTLPLYTPMCVSPKINLVDLLNLFQTGRVGHLALVCARPTVGSDALSAGITLPEAAGLMGIITLEDVLEALLQEQIYDETDKVEREAERIARWASKKWKRFLQNRKRERALEQGHEQAVSMGTVVQIATTAHQNHHADEEAVGERTTLLRGGGGSSDTHQKSNGSFNIFGFFGGNSTGGSGSES
jgi:metal transporter CNNM